MSRSNGTPSLGTWLRTIARLHPRQILGRPSFRLRRRLIPQACRLLGSNSGNLTPSTSLRELPCPLVLSSDELGALGGGRLALVGFEAPLPGPGEVSGCDDPLYRYSLADLTWLRAAGESDSELRGQLGHWLGEQLSHPPEPGSVFWDPYPLATRILNLAVLTARGQAPPGFGRGLRRWLFTLAGLRETHLLGNHLLRDHAGLAVGGALLGGASGRYFAARGWRGLCAEVERQFTPDGLHTERAPGYHLQVVLDLLACAAVARDRWAAGWDTALYPRFAEHLVGALGALEVLAHEDGRVAAFGDTAPASLCAVEPVLEFGRTLGLEPAAPAPMVAGPWSRLSLSQGGFSRLVGDEGLEVFLNHGPFGASDQPGHAHCDLFAFELDVAGQRVICDPGVHAYHEPLWRRRSRGTSAHSTPHVEGREQAEIWSRFRCGWRPRLERVEWTANEHGWGFVGLAVAFGPRDPLTLRRSLVCHRNTVTVSDSVGGQVDFSVALTIAPGLRAHGEGDRSVVPLEESRLTVEALCGRVELSSGWVSHRFGERLPAQVLRLRSVAGQLEFRLGLS